MWVVTITTENGNQAWFINRKYKKTAVKLARKYNQLRGFRARVKEFAPDPDEGLELRDNVKERLRKYLRNRPGQG